MNINTIYLLKGGINMAKNQPIEFFDRYNNFYETSVTGAISNRLNNRYKALIDSNKALINEQRILDLASHDGRWTFAALKNGAKHVVGIEARPHLVQNSIKNMNRYAIPKRKYDFILGDLLFDIKKVKKNEIDTVFCFGFLYHTIHHMDLLMKIKKINPKYLIIDSLISKSPLPIIKLKMEKTNGEGAAISNNFNNNQTIIGLPSRSSLEMMLKSIGFSVVYHDWDAMNIKDWRGLQDYKNGLRVTLICKNLDYSRD
jgi:SAM-dependent methyltransferase